LHNYYPRERPNPYTPVSTARTRADHRRDLGTLEQALARVAIVAPAPPSNHQNGNGGNGNAPAGPIKGVLEILPSGPIPPDPGEFVATRALSDLLEQLRDRADVVLVDAPPVLRVGDAMTLSRKVDGIIAVTRARLVRRNMLAELHRQLASVPTPVLGFVVTGSAEEEGYRYGYGGDYGYTRPHDQGTRAGEPSQA
jgi:Mrp family chromosome partitioning ATPase